MKKLQSKQKLRLGLAFSLSLSLMLFAALPVFDLAAAVHGEVAPNRGDNPVVGSLPCYEDDSLDLMFWRALGHSEPNVQVFAHRPTLGFVGSYDLGSRVVAADGTPFGIVNRNFGFDVFAVERQAVAEFWLSDVASGEISMWQWLPREYFGAKLMIEGPNFQYEGAITAPSTKLPIQELLAAVPNMARTRVLIVPNAMNAGARPIEMYISNVGELVFVDYRF